MTNKTVLPTVVPALSAWAILVEIKKPGEAVDYYAEPVIAWLIDPRGGPPVPMTAKGRGTVVAPQLRPDDSVKHGDYDYPDFSAFLRHQRGGAWEQSASRPDEGTPLDPLSGEALVAAGPNESRPKLHS
jgi:hypothetical protein